MGMQPIGDNEMFNPDVLKKYIHHNIGNVTCKVIKTKVDELIAVPTAMEIQSRRIEEDFDHWIMNKIKQGVSFDNHHVEFRTISETNNFGADIAEFRVICEIKENEKESN